jgi:hypothetical protein
MGQMRFLVPRPEQISELAVQCAYLAGMEGIPWRSVNRCEGDLLIIERELNESGCLFIPWDEENHGRLVLSTATLMERDQPYNLPVELARGTINRLRHQASEWQAMIWLRRKRPPIFLSSP